MTETIELAGLSHSIREGEDWLVGIERVGIYWLDSWGSEGRGSR